MKGNKSHQPGRGNWKKSRQDRGIFLRGKMWYVRYTDADGQLHVERAGPSKAAARRRYQQRKAAIDEGRFDPAQARRAVSFDELVKDAITRGREAFQLKYPTKKFYEGRYNIICGWFTGRKARSITPQEIIEKLAARCANQSAATRNHLRIALSHTFKVGIENKKVNENPAILVRLLKLNNTRVRYLNQHRQDEEQAIRTAIRFRWPKREAEFDLALNTGMRKSEQYGLRWSSVDLKHDQITIERSKHGEKRMIPLNDEAQKALAKLRAYAPASEFVCPDPDEAHRRKFWDAALELAGVTDFHWHDCRHTFASRLVMAGVPILEVKEVMGHKTLSVTLRYAHLAPSKLHDAVSKLGAFTDTVSDTAVLTSPPIIH